MIRIVTDSAANMPPELAERYGITIVPLKVLFGNDQYREGVDIDEAEFFSRLAQANPLPTTSQPSPLDFEEPYRQIIEAGDEIISIHLSSDLSGTYNSARNGALSVSDDRISIVDTRSVSAGTALIILAAARMVEAGQSRAEIVPRLEAMGQSSLLTLTVETLDYLRRGGRIGGATALIGGLFNIKPIILIKDGKVGAGGRARSRKKALEQVVAMQAEQVGNQPVWVGLAEAQADDVDALESIVRSRLNVQELIHCKIGPVVATHAGPGVVGLAAMPVPST